MSMRELQLEYDEEVIGGKILKLVDELTWNVARPYDPRVYGGAASWAEAHEDLLYSFVAEVLLEQGQLEYAMFVASSEKHFKNLIARQLRFFLARRRQRTVVDNLLDRSKQITSSTPFRQGTETATWWYELEDEPAADHRPSPDEIARASGELSVIPLQSPSSTDRASQVYSTPNLTRLLRTVASRLECRLTVKDLDEIFRRLLTPWLPSFLSTDEEVFATQTSTTMDAEQEDMARQAAHAIHQVSTPIELGVLAMKIADTSDVVIGQHFSISRPTVIKHKKTVLANVEAELTGLSEACQTRAIEVLTSLIEEASDAT